MNTMMPGLVMAQFFRGFGLRWVGVLMGMAAIAVLLWGWMAVSDCRHWQDWELFKQTFISEDGRVVDAETPRKHTVSEGQAYALFFALVANDRSTFDKLLRWTEDNLARGDLSANLPAWQWGRRDDDSWGVVDANSASDADLWLAYALGEAGRLWREPRYTALSHLLTNRILRDEVAEAAKLGPVLLPAPIGFRSEDVWRLNPSYLPLQLLRRLANDNPESAWPAILETSARVIGESAFRGFAPDWVLYQGSGKFVADSETQGRGSYDAIRVYLWTGMMSAEDPLRDKLLSRLGGMANYLGEKGVPPETVDTVSGHAENAGSSGFSAALLPFSAARNDSAALKEQLLRVRARPVHDRPTAYYDHVLALFGLGWHEGYFSFAADGALQTRWRELCSVSR